MELRHLRYFVAVAEELNFRKAAERLHVAQPALSSQIQDLEYDLGVKVLERNTGGVRLTDAGAAFLAAARLTLAQAEEAVAAARDAEKGRRGRLRVGYIAPLLMGFMPASLKAFHRQYPDVEVDPVEMPLGDQMAALKSRAIHLGFAIGGLGPLPPGMQHVPVVRSPIRAVVARGHRLARLRRISLTELKDEPLLSLAVKRGSTVHGDIIRRIFAARALKHSPVRSVESVEIFRDSLEGGLGVSLIAESGSLARNPGLRFKALRETGEDLFLDLHALWPEGATSKLTANFLAVIQQVAPRESRGTKSPD